MEMPIKLIEASAKKLWFTIWLWSPFHTWKTFLMYWRFAEYFNIEISFIPTECLNIDIFLPSGRIQFGWFGGKWDTGAPRVIDYKMFKQKKASTQILSELGYIDCELDSTENLKLFRLK